MKLGITGHQNLPEEGVWEWVRREFARVMEERGPDHVEAYSSLAIGADQEFADMAIKSGIALHVIVPCSGYEKTFGTQVELQRYMYLLRKAKTVELLDYPEPSEEAFMAAGKKIVDKVDVLVAVWNGKEGRGTGGTDDTVTYALARQKSVVQLDPLIKTVSRLPVAAS